MQPCFGELREQYTPLQVRDETLALARVLNLPCKDLVNLRGACFQELKTNTEHAPSVQKHWLRRQPVHILNGKLGTFIPKVKSAASQKQIYLETVPEGVRSRTY